MITSNSTYEEIERQKALDEKNIRDFLANTFSRDGNKIKRILRVKTYYTPTKPATFHSHTTNIHWRILQILMHSKKLTPLERAQRYTFILECENQIKYTIINDLNTSKPILVLPYPNQAFFVSAHAVRRYKERTLGNPDLDFTATCDTFIRRSPYYVLRGSSYIYGTTKYNTIVFRVADGLFLGYYDSDRQIGHLETYISVDMLTEKQKSISDFKYNDEILRNQRDLVLGLIPFDEKLSQSMVSGNHIYREEDDNLKEMSMEEIEELARIAREEYDAIPEEVHQQRMAEEQQENRERYKRKMMRKGYM